MRLKVSPATVRALAGPVIKALARSWRITTVNEERWRSIVEAGRPHVFLAWHEALLPLLWHHRSQAITLVVSEARDGQYLVDFTSSLGYGAVRGSSTRGAARALLGAVRELQAGGTVAFAPDGPLGPRRELKPGAIAAAQRGGAVVVPVHAEASRAWRLSSWDRFLIPKPAARVRIIYGRPFEIGAGEDGLNRGVAEAVERLGEIAGAAE